MTTSCYFKASNWISRPKKYNSKSYGLPNSYLEKHLHGLSYANRFTTWSAYKLGLKSTILAEKAQNIAHPLTYI